jgi:type I restriction enzyme, S subunit
MENSSILSDYAQIVMGQSPEGSTASKDRIGLPLLNGPTEFGGSYPTPNQFTSDPRKRAITGDLLFCVRGSTTGRMNWADQEYAIGRGLAAIRHRKGREFQPFVRAVIEHNLPGLLIQATGSTFPNVSSQQLASIPFPKLKDSEQRAIAHVLGSLDDKIELNRQMNETLEEMARTLFRSWFVDFDPVRAKAEGRQPQGMDAETAALFPSEFVESELGMIPKGWKVGKVGEVGDIICGKTPSTAVPEYYGKDIPFITIPDMHNKVFAVATSRHLSTKGAMSQVKKMIPAGSVCVSCIATPGLVCIATENSVIPNQPLSYFYWYFSLENIGSDIRSSGGGGSVYDNLSTGRFMQLSILVPQSDLILMFHKVVAPMLEKYLFNEKEINRISQIRDNLLPKLISGEIRLPDDMIAEFEE